MRSCEHALSAPGIQNGRNRNVHRMQFKRRFEKKGQCLRSKIERSHAARFLQSPTSYNLSMVAIVWDIYLPLSYGVGLNQSGGTDGTLPRPLQIRTCSLGQLGLLQAGAEARMAIHGDLTSSRVNTPLQFPQSSAQTKTHVFDTR